MRKRLILALLAAAAAVTARRLPDIADTARSAVALRGLVNPAGFSGAASSTPAEDGAPRSA
jgi:hypothetical protein